MSEKQIVKLLKRLDEMLQKMEHIESMLLQQSLPEVEEMDSKEMAFYIGQSLGFLFKMPRDYTPEEDMACYEELYLQWKEICRLIMSKAVKSISSKATEREKLAILLQEGG